MTFKLHNMNNYTYKVTFLVSIETELTQDDAIDELTSECEYDFFNTENCKILNTRWEETELL